MTLYFSVIGNRDYIKLKGEKLPYWHFLDEQPAGWLTSLTYKRKGLPTGKPMIYDCGAWSYKDKEIPPVDAYSVADLYLEYALPGTMCIAPDHMLIPGCDVLGRRIWNKTQAREFLRVCPEGMTPMATIHGMDDDERVHHALELLDMGYKHLSLGGMAARASQPKIVVEAVEWVRSITDGAWLHVLGLSSPTYLKKWDEFGVDSCDGSSHFKQAFTAGAFFTQEGGALSRHAASRPGEPIPEDMPICSCSACLPLREEGIDTRTYGSNENNMGRAAHNLNMLMRAQKAAVQKTTVLVACCGPKLDGIHPAQDLYQSDLFKKSRAYAEKVGDRWAILSALHGVVMPDQRIGNYDRTLTTIPAPERREWTTRVTEQIHDQFPGDRLIVLAGNNYCQWVNGELPAERPMEGLGIGQQLRWLIDNTPAPSLAAWVN